MTGSQKQGQKIIQKQQMSISQQLSRAIHILQLSAQELKTELEQAYMNNPVLELEYNLPEQPPALKDFNDPRSNSSYTSRDENNHSLNHDLRSNHERPSYDRSTYYDTIADELLHQATVIGDKMQHRIAEFIIYSLDERGFLPITITELAQAVGTTEKLALQVLRMVQEFEPAGIAAQSIKEGLIIQAKRRGIYAGIVKQIMDNHLRMLALGRISAIAKALGSTPEEVQIACDEIKKLNPIPASGYKDSRTIQYILPDVIVSRTQDGLNYSVELNDGNVPIVKLSPLYSHKICGNEGYDAETVSYINSRIDAANWLIKCIEQRRSTIISMVEELVHHQSDYIKKGPAFLHPLTMAEVARKLGVHESTVSRAAANKYVQLPNGQVVALKKFFTNRIYQKRNNVLNDSTTIKMFSTDIHTDSASNHKAAKSFGESESKKEPELSPAQIKVIIKQLIAHENPSRPLSDQKITDSLHAKGIDIARRTIVKYREQLGLPSSTARKRY